MENRVYNREKPKGVLPREFYSFWQPKVTVLSAYLTSVYSISKIIPYEKSTTINPQI